MPKLFYVLGASGAGKDSLIDAVRDQFSDRLMVAHRYITRPASAGSENHVALSDAEFDLRVERGLFTMQWRANGMRYGVGREVENWLEAGLDVMVNGSRAYLPLAQGLFGKQLEVVWISVSQQVLRERLEARGRESAEEIAQRLERAVEYESLKPHDAICLDNSGALADTVAQFACRLDQKLCQTYSAQNRAKAVKL
ncbi:ribose 1,5-bisphosphokinase [Enterovibrio paralichthyis]|uniref:ribose 1,5-bisphosphokinase n=1 Tax=Enterovibrio paralichthyis TaxID=2853805 RepID=UPI001C485045|nr:ribose 1,5-bisphosphokinase [Enterovibrio paralichthyis]MBV7296928.1 ribose 1,5-bisphosphokinase [Enterovibrio paralichthyis]